MPAKKAVGRLQREKLAFRGEMLHEIEAKKQQISAAWREHTTQIESVREQIDGRYDALICQLEAQYAAVSRHLLLFRQRNTSLASQIEETRSLKTKLQNQSETTNLEISAEIDLELKLQQRASELQVQLGDSRRRLGSQLEKKVKLKKAYLRVINQYKKLKDDDELRECRRKALVKKALLEQQRKEREEEEQRAKEAANDPRNKYRALLAAAGHIDGEDPIGARPDCVTFYDGPTVAVAKAEQPIVVESPKYQQCVWLENNIRTLLSTGNYTEDDPVIRRLKAQLAPTLRD
jgi:hypothetical protein